MYNDLRNLARDQGRATDELSQLYLLERFLYRLAHNRLDGQLVLKGGTLLAAYQLRRATCDIDVQALDLTTDPDTSIVIWSELLSAASNSSNVAWLAPIVKSSFASYSYGAVAVVT